MHLKRDTHSCFIHNFNPIFSKVLQENIDSKCVSNYRKAVVRMTSYKLRAMSSDIQVTSSKLQVRVQIVPVQSITGIVLLDF